MILKRALLVGVDHYENFSTLSGCINDIEALEPLLSRHEDGSPNFRCRRITSGSSAPRDQVTRDRLLQETEELFHPSADAALLYFAGHGAEQNNDVALVTQDGSRNTPGVGLANILGIAQNSSIQNVVIILDCCFSGKAGGSPQLAGDVAHLSTGTALLTASRGDQTAAEIPEGRGAFSSMLCGALDGGAADVVGKVTLAGIYAYLSESFGPWEQRPTFKANVDRLNKLRACTPAVPLEELRRLPELFPSPDHEFALDSSYEPTKDPAHPERHDIFAILQRCRSAKLVEPVNENHMFYAAVREESCQLTRLGRHYWKLADQGLL